MKVFSPMPFQAAGDIRDASNPCNPRGPGDQFVEAGRFGLADGLLMSSHRPSNST